MPGSWLRTGNLPYCRAPDKWANRQIDWDRQPLRQVNKAILYIVEDSIQNAENPRA
jgi:hypothetical protein